MMFYRYATTADAEVLLKIRRAAVLGCGNEHYSTEQLMAWAPKIDVATIKVETEQLNSRDRVTIIAAFDSNDPNYSLNLANDNFFNEKTTQRDLALALVGLCTIGLSEGLLKQCYILPQYRGMGIAKEMVRAVEDIAREKGLNILKLSSSLIAFRFYEKMGYRTLERYDYDLGNGLVMKCVMMYKNI